MKITSQVQMIELHPERHAPFFTHFSCYNNSEIWGIKFRLCLDNKMVLLAPWDKKKLELADIFCTQVHPAALANTTTEKDFIALISAHF